jgi:hypothetical protein
LLSLVLTENSGGLFDSQLKIEAREVFAHDDMGSLRAWVIDRKVNDLSFQGLGALESYCRKQFGFSLLPDRVQRQALGSFIAIRNLLVHKRGIVDRRFIRVVGDSRGDIGEKVTISGADIELVMNTILECVESIDQRASRHFKFQPADVAVIDVVGETERDFRDHMIAQVLGWQR